MDNDIMYNELESMKAQMDLLKKKLERQEIVKEQHLRKAIKGKLNEINGIAVRMMVAGVFALVCNVLLLNHFGYSLYLQAGTFAMIAFSVIATYVQHRKLLEARELSADLLKETFELVKLKRRYAQWLWLAMPMVALWVSFLVYETFYVIPVKELAVSLVTGIAVGAVIGFIAGLRIHFRTLKKIDEMLARIDEIRSEL
jgi:amino acid transporter